MKKEIFAAIWIEGSIAFLIPFLTAMAVALGPYVPKDAPPPSAVGWFVIICAPLVAGLSALKSFLSTAFADAKSATNGALASQPNPPQLGTAARSAPSATLSPEPSGRRPSES